MGIEDTIIQKLTELESILLSGGDEQRRLSVETPQDVAPAIFAEIDGTVLPRSLTFTNDAGMSLALDVSGGRILSVTSISPADSLPEDVELFSSRVDEENDQQLTDLSRIFWMFSNGASNVEVLSRPSPAGHRVDEVGYSSSEINVAFVSFAEDAMAAELEALPEFPATRLGRFQSISYQYASVAVGLSLSDGSITHGDADTAPELLAFATEHCAAGDELAVRLVIMQGGPEEPAALAYVHDDQEFWAFSFAKTDTAAIAACWQSSKADPSLAVV